MTSSEIVAAQLLEGAITETLRDMIANSTNCGCCNSDTEHAALIRRALQRFPIDLWPHAGCEPAFCANHTEYQSIVDALRTRSKAGVTR